MVFEEWRWPRLENMCLGGGTLNAHFDVAYSGNI